MDEELHKAIACGDLSKVVEMISNGGSVNLIYGMKGTPLCSAIASNKPDIVKHLLSDPSCDVNAKDFDGESPLCLAVRKGFTDLACELAKHPKCDLNKLDPISGESAIHIAIKENNIAVVDTLTRYNCDVNRETKDSSTPLHYCMLQQNEEALKIILGLYPRLYAHKDFTPLCWLHPLHIAVNQNFIRGVILLLDYASAIHNIELIDVPTLGEQYTALHLAVQHCSFDLTKLLLVNSADPNAMSASKMTPLGQAGQTDLTNFAALILEHGADPNIHVECQIRSSTNSHMSSNLHPKYAYQSYSALCSPLHIAVMNNSFKSAQLLLMYHADINSLDSNRHSPVSLAISFRRLELLSYFLEDTNTSSLIDMKMFQNREPKTLLSHCCSQGLGEFCQRLIDLGSDVNITPNPPLLCATALGHLPVAQTLLDNGASVTDSCGSDGLSLLCHSAILGNIDMVHLMVKNGADTNFTSDVESSLKTITPLELAFFHSFHPKNIVVVNFLLLTASIRLNELHFWADAAKTLYGIPCEEYSHTHNRSTDTEILDSKEENNSPNIEADKGENKDSSESILDSENASDTEESEDHSENASDTEESEDHSENASDTEESEDSENASDAEESQDDVQFFSVCGCIQYEEIEPMARRLKRHIITYPEFWQYYAMAVIPCTLRQQCRNVIYSHYRNQKLDFRKMTRLPLPKAMKDYLLFTQELASAKSPYEPSLAENQ